MAEKHYLFQKTTGEWVFGPTTNSVMPAGLLRLANVSETNIELRWVHNRDIAYRYAELTYGSFYKENGSAYSSLAGFLADTKDFFSGSQKVSIEAGDIQLGAVELKDASADTRAKIAAGSAVVAGDNALAVADANVKTTLANGSQKAQLVDASANFLYPSGEVATGSAEITRPADTTAYASGDSINSSTSSPVASEITGMAIKSGGGGLLDSIKIESDITAMASKTVRVWVFNDTPATITNDNAAFTTAYADKAKLLFFEDVVMEALEGTSDNVIGVLSVAKAYKCAATSLFILVQAVSAFTPTSGGKVNVTLNAIKLN
jgi:hypothetical protein